MPYLIANLAFLFIFSNASVTSDLKARSCFFGNIYSSVASSVLFSNGWFLATFLTTTAVVLNLSVLACWYNRPFLIKLYRRLFSVSTSSDESGTQEPISSTEIGSQTHTDNSSVVKLDTRTPVLVVRNYCLPEQFNWISGPIVLSKELDLRIVKESGTYYLINSKIKAQLVNDSTHIRLYPVKVSVLPPFVTAAMPIFENISYLLIRQQTPYSNTVFCEPKMIRQSVSKFADLLDFGNFIRAPTTLKYIYQVLKKHFTDNGVCFFSNVRTGKPDLRTDDTLESNEYEPRYLNFEFIWWPDHSALITDKLRALLRARVNQLLQADPAHLDTFNEFQRAAFAHQLNTVSKEFFSWLIDEGYLELRLNYLLEAKANSIENKAVNFRFFGDVTEFNGGQFLYLDSGTHILSLVPKVPNMPGTAAKLKSVFFGCNYYQHHEFPFTPIVEYLRDRNIPYPQDLDLLAENWRNMGYICNILRSTEEGQNRSLSWVFDHCLSIAELYTAGVRTPLITTSFFSLLKHQSYNCDNPNASPADYVVNPDLFSLPPSWAKLEPDPKFDINEYHLTFIDGRPTTLLSQP